MTEEFERTDSLPTRPSLLGRLVNITDDHSWREFYLTYEVHVRKIARRRGLAEEDAQEVAQDVLRRVAETIHAYKPIDRRGAFRSWLFQLTRWRASDRLRHQNRNALQAGLLVGARERQSDLAGSPPEPEPGSSGPEVHRQFELEAQRYLLDTLLSRLERTVSKRNLQIFQMVMLDDVPIARVAELFRIRPAAVYVVKHRVLEKLRTEVDQLSPLLD